MFYEIGYENFLRFFLFLALENCGNSSLKSNQMTSNELIYENVKYPLVMNLLGKYEKKPFLLTDVVGIKYIP